MDKNLGELSRREIMKMDEAPEKRSHAISGIFRAMSWGLLLALFSGFMHSCNSIIVKYLKDIFPGQLVFCRYWAIASFTLPQVVLAQQNMPGPHGYRISIITRGICSVTSSFLQFIAFRYLPVGEATVLICSYPIFVTLAAKLVLKESFGWLHVISLTTTLVGMVLTTGLYQAVIVNSRVFTKDDAYGFSAAIGSVLINTLMYILTRKLKHISSSVLLFNTGCVGVIESVILTALIGNFSLHCSCLEQVLIILLGILSYLGTTGITVALQYAKAGPVTTLRASAAIFFSFLWQTFIFGDVPDGITILGSIFVGVSIVVVGYGKSIDTFFRSICLKR